MPAFVDAPLPITCQVCDARATHEVRSVSSGWKCYRCDEHTELVRRGPNRGLYHYTPLRTVALDTTVERDTMIATAEKSGTVEVKRPDFFVEVSRASRGVVLEVRSASLHAHLSGLSEGRTSVNAAGRTVWSIPTSRLRGSSLFTIAEPVTALLLDCALNDGHKIKIADVMTPAAAKDYVRDLMSAFSEYVRDYMSALRITGTVTIDETVLRRSPIAESV